MWISETVIETHLLHIGLIGQDFLGLEKKRTRDKNQPRGTIIQSLKVKLIRSYNSVYTCYSSELKKKTKQQQLKNVLGLYYVHQYLTSKWKIIFQIDLISETFIILTISS